MVFGILENLNYRKVSVKDIGNYLIRVLRMGSLGLEMFSRFFEVICRLVIEDVVV